MPCTPPRAGSRVTPAAWARRLWDDDIGGEGLAVAELTERQEKFARFFVNTGNAAEAYRLAGYKDARQNAGRLMTNDDVLRRIEELRAPAQAKAETDAEWIRRRLKEEAEATGEGTSQSARVSALTTLAKIEGMLIDRKRVEKRTEVAIVRVTVSKRADAGSLLSHLAEAGRVSGRDDAG